MLCVSLHYVSTFKDSLSLPWTYIMRILTGFVVVQENIKPEVLKVQAELVRSVQ